MNSQKLTICICFVPRSIYYGCEILSWLFISFIYYVYLCIYSYVRVTFNVIMINKNLLFFYDLSIISEFCSRHSSQFYDLNGQRKIKKIYLFIEINLIHECVSLDSMKLGLSVTIVWSGLMKISEMVTSSSKCSQSRSQKREVCLYIWELRLEVHT